MARGRRAGNVNVAKFGPRLAGAGGFINISQTARKVVFLGGFLAGSQQFSISNGAVRTGAASGAPKFVDAVEHITFSGTVAAHAGRRVVYTMALRLAENDPGLAAFIAECNRMGTSEAVIETAEKRGYSTGSKAVHPFDESRHVPGLCRQFRADGIRHGRDFRLPGA